jgi:hypothetical protein
MAGRKNAAPVRDWRQTVFAVVCLIIVLSMVLGLVASAFSF